MKNSGRCGLEFFLPFFFFGPKFKKKNSSVKSGVARLSQLWERVWGSEHTQAVWMNMITEKVGWAEQLSQPQLQNCQSLNTLIHCYWDFCLSAPVSITLKLLDIASIWPVSKYFAAIQLGHAHFPKLSLEVERGWPRPDYPVWTGSI